MSHARLFASADDEDHPKSNLYNRLDQPPENLASWIEEKHGTKTPRRLFGYDPLSLLFHKALLLNRKEHIDQCMAYPDKIQFNDQTMRTFLDKTTLTCQEVSTATAGLKYIMSTYQLVSNNESQKIKSVIIKHRKQENDLSEEKKSSDCMKC